MSVRSQPARVGFIPQYQDDIFRYLKCFEHTRNLSVELELDTSGLNPQDELDALCASSMALNDALLDLKSISKRLEETLIVWRVAISDGLLLDSRESDAHCADYDRFREEHRIAATLLQLDDCVTSLKTKIFAQRVSILGLKAHIQKSLQASGSSTPSSADSSQEQPVAAVYGSDPAPTVQYPDHTGPSNQGIQPISERSQQPPEATPVQGMCKSDHLIIRASGPSSFPMHRTALTPHGFAPASAPQAAVREIVIPGNNPFYKPAVVMALQDTVNGPCVSTFESKYSKNFCPPFNGDTAEFPGWQERFITFIHSHWPPLSEQQKLMCLLDHLQGDPAAKLKHLAMHGSNFTEACILLQERYGREDLLLMSLKASLRTISAPDSSVSSLTQFHDTAYGLMVQLRNCGEDLGSNSTLTQDLYALLPLKLRLEVVTMQLPERSERTMAAILACLRRHITRLDEEHMVEKFRISSVNRPVSSSYKAPDNSSGYKALARTPQCQTLQGHTSDTRGVNASGYEHDSYCPLCEEKGHNPTDCNRFATVAARLDIAKRKRLCFTCLVNEKKHGRCTVRHSKCATCTHGYHHAALCRTFIRQQQGKHESEDSGYEPSHSSGRSASPTRRYSGCHAPSDVSDDENYQFHRGAQPLPPQSEEGYDDPPYYSDEENQDHPAYQRQRTVA